MGGKLFHLDYPVPAKRELLSPVAGTRIRQMSKIPGYCLLIFALFVSVAGGQAQTFSVLYNLGTHTGDPEAPYEPGVVAQGRDGNLYSTTTNGGSTVCTDGCGTVFKITPAGELTVLHEFDDAQGQYPFSGVSLGTDGDFYGTTVLGGASHVGTVFKITPNGDFTVLHTFSGADGSEPYAPPIQATDGNFYGTTSQGGVNGSGTVYKITPAGKFTSLYSFDDKTVEYYPMGLVQAKDGNFYGTDRFGGDGQVFRVTPAGEFTSLYSFDETHGADPCGSLIQGWDGNFYGTTQQGGPEGYGVVYKITSSGVLTVLHYFASQDGTNPYAGLVQASDGNLYGVTSGGLTGLGTIFRISPEGTFSVDHNFDGTDGANPYAILSQHTDGILYGDTVDGGTGQCNGGCGTFYSLNVGMKPFVSLVPISGSVGKSVGILGQGFKGTASVSFNGTPAKFKAASDTYMIATVPSGATTGFVTVTTPKGKLTSNKKFRVIK